MAYFPVYPTGWPWPLNAVQDWFEALWEHITHAAQTAARWILDHLPDPISSWFSRISETIRAVVAEAIDVTSPYVAALPWPLRGVIQFFLIPAGLLYVLVRPMFAWVWDRIGPMLSTVAMWVVAAREWVTGAFVNFTKDPLGSLSGVTDWLWQKVKGPLTGVWTRIQAFGEAAWTGLAAFAKDPVGTLNTGFSWVRTGVTTMLNGAMETLGGWVKDALGGVASALGKGLQEFLGFLVGRLEWLASGIMGVVGPISDVLRGGVESLVGGFIDTLKSGYAPGSPQPETYKKMLDLVMVQQKRVVEKISEAYRSPVELGAIIRTAGMVAALLGTAIIGVKALASAADAAHPMKDIGFKDIARTMVASTAAATSMAALLRAPVDIGLITPLRYAYNRMFTPLVPREDALIALRTERIIDDAAYLDGMAQHGLSAEWSYRLLDRTWRVPGYGELREMLWRGDINTATLKGSLRFMSVREDFIDAYVALTERIPGPGDLVTMAVREVFTRPELQAELPTEFVEWMQKQGYTSPWPAYFWAMHWRLPSVTQVYDMHHRGIPMPFTVEEFLRLADMSPEWRGPLEKLSWSLPGAIYSRWMFRWGELGVDQLEELLVKGGLDPEWAPTVARAVAKNQFLREIRALETNIKADLRDGFITEATARADFTELGYPDSFVEYHVKDALRDRARKHHLARLDLYEDWYLKDLLTIDELESHAAEIIVCEAELKLFLEDAWIRKYKPPEAA